MTSYYIPYRIDIAFNLNLSGQAFKNMLPALGNDFMSMMKDSSLLSVLAVNDLTQKGRLYAASSFRFQETYLVLTVLYLIITLTLSIFQRKLENSRREHLRLEIKRN